jgi:spore coat protein U-like protein
MKNRLRMVMPIAVLAALPVTQAIPAQNQSTTFQVRTTVLASCQVSASDLVFGNYSPNSASALQGQSEITVTCSPNTQYNIALDAGLGSGATTAQRRMTSGSSTLNYMLYRQPNRNPNEIWGNVSGTDTTQSNGTGLAQVFSVYGTIPAAQIVPAGNYVDTITVQVLF